MKIFYKNPLINKFEFLITTCVLCRKRILMRKKNIIETHLGDLYFECKRCINGILYRGNKQRSKTDIEKELLHKIYQNFRKLGELWNISMNDAFMKFMDIYYGKYLKSTIKSVIKNLLQESVSDKYNFKKSELNEYLDYYNQKNI